MRITQEQIEAVLEGGHELQSLEVKGAGPATDSNLFAKVAKGAMGLGNIQDGGHIVIGIDDRSMAEMTPGLGPDDLATWLDFDSVSAKMAVYSAPPVSFNVEALQLSNGRTVAILEVAEFADAPHICVKQYDGALLNGRIYIRTRSMPETAPIESPAELRELLDLAADKRLRAFVERVDRAGLRLTTEDAGRSDEQRFADERRRAWDD